MLITFILREKTMMNRNSAGFTIIELMIAVAIIGVLAAIAIPAYSNYVTRAKVSEAFSFAQAAKTAVAEYYQSHGSLPASNSDAGIGSMSGTNVTAVDVGSNGVIKVTLNTAISGITNGANTLAFAPAASESGITWSCTTAAGTTINPQYLPSACK